MGLLVKNQTKLVFRVRLAKQVCKSFVRAVQAVYNTTATFVNRVGTSIGPSLILHGRTEIKARALVLGEVSALFFLFPIEASH